MNKIWMVCTRTRCAEGDDMKMMRAFPEHLIEYAKYYAKSLLKEIDDQHRKSYKFGHTGDRVEVRDIDLEKRLPSVDLNERFGWLMECWIDYQTGELKVTDYQEKK